MFVYNQLKVSFYIKVTGFTENAPTLVRYAVKVGDRVLAVDSSLGEKMDKSPRLQQDCRTEVNHGEMDFTNG